MYLVGKPSDSTKSWARNCTRHVARGTSGNISNEGFSTKLRVVAGIGPASRNRVKLCEQCQLSRHLPPKVPLHPWEWPEHPWSRIHVDYAGPFLGKWFLLMVDAHSKWIEVGIVSSATSTSTIEKLRAIFATHGLPEVIVSDNGTVLPVPHRRPTCHPGMGPPSRDFSWDRNVWFPIPRICRMEGICAYSTYKYN